MNPFFSRALICLLLLSHMASGAPLYTYTLSKGGLQDNYDEAMAAATLQGLINRKSPEFYVLSRNNSRPQRWLDVMRENGHWLHGRETQPLTNLDAVVKLAGSRVKGAVIWDPAVPASVNVATTIAGIEDAVVLSPEFAERYLPRWKLPVVKDLRGMFTGAETGSKKNDAYRWAIRQYLAPGDCSAHLLCLFEDSFATRATGDAGYAITRDWAVKNRAFVFDLSPWGDEAPADDPGQKLGADLETYTMILTETLRHSAGKQMTELNGFFAQSKYAQRPGHNSVHEGVPTEWATIWLISPYNCYQNTITSECFNQSLHSQAPRHPLKQTSVAHSLPLEKKAYICFLMADYDSATPLYDFLPKYWPSLDRGKIPLAWGINPNLLESYPDLVAYYYSTATTNDTFTSDASAAGYMNPNRIDKKYLPLFIRHNQGFFHEADMTMAPMVLDQDQPSPQVKDAFQQFAPDGFATIVMSLNQRPGNFPPRQIWKGMPVMELLNDTCISHEPGQIADAVAAAILGRGNKAPSFYFFRVIWLSPTKIIRAMDELHKTHPEIDFKVVGPREFFELFKQSQTK